MTHYPKESPRRERFSIPEPRGDETSSHTVASDKAGRGHARRHAVKPQRDSQERIKYVIAGVFVLVTLLVLGSALFHSADSDGAGVASTHASGEGKKEDAAPRGEGPVFQGGYEGLDIGDLPPGAPLTQESSNKFTTVGHPSERVGQGTKNKYTYVVEVEDTITPDNIGGFDAFAAMVDATLSNPKSWIADPEISFQHVKEEDLPAGQEPDFRFQLTTVKTTHDVCGNSYNLETSCFMPIGHRVVINEARWLRGAQPYEGDLGGYRQYVINHEVGHGVGYAAHQPCVKNGGLAPVMMQQTLSLSNDELHNINPQEVYKKDGMTCVANPWPYPQGKKTQEDSAANGNRSD